MATSDERLERSTLAKASWRLLPLIGLGYGVAFMDRANISFAALQMNADLRFSATVYGLGAGLFFLSYAFFEIPSNLLLVRFGARRWIARIMLTWGALAVGMMFVRTPMQFYLMRFLLGLAEAGFFPGVIYYLTLWFPAAHRGRAISRFYIAWPLSTLVMGAVAGSLLGLRGQMGLAGWQWLFLVEGAPALALSVVILFLLPDSPAQARWLSDEEMRWLERRLASDAAALGGSPHRDPFTALLRPRVLALAAANFLILGAYYAFNLSAPAVLQSATHLGATRVGFLVATGGALGAGAMLFNGWHSDRTGERYFHLAAPLALIACAFAVMAATATPLVVMGAYVTAVTCNAAVAGVFWLAPGAILHPRAAAVGVAAINTIGQIGSFLLPYLWGIAKDATGSYRVGLSAVSAFTILAVAIVLLLRQRTKVPREAPA